jgi:hypothetical protein
MRGNLSKEQNNTVSVIKTIHSQKVNPLESHFRINVNGKIVEFAKWVDMDFIEDYEFIKGKESLSDDEYDDVIGYINDATI